MPTKEYIQSYRQKRKQWAIDYLGGKCCNCGSLINLQFDHIDPNDKSGQISSMLTSNKKEFLIEVKKCQLLCYSCHQEKSILNGDYIRNRVGWKHGMSGYVNHKCRCDICKKAYHEYSSNRWKNRKDSMK